tara:strand:+ start:10579 stop:10806 length:228 start_codon:yes stop_codon:yes gene_type:complete
MNNNNNNNNNNNTITSHLPTTPNHTHFLTTKARKSLGDRSPKSTAKNKGVVRAHASERSPSGARSKTMHCVLTVH